MWHDTPRHDMTWRSTTRHDTAQHNFIQVTKKVNTCAPLQHYYTFLLQAIQIGHHVVSLLSVYLVVSFFFNFCRIQLQSVNFLKITFFGFCPYFVFCCCLASLKCQTWLYQEHMTVDHSSSFPGFCNSFVTQIIMFLLANNYKYSNIHNYTSFEPYMRWPFSLIPRKMPYFRTGFDVKRKTIVSMWLFSVSSLSIFKTEYHIDIRRSTIERTGWRRKAVKNSNGCYTLLTGGSPVANEQA